MIEEKRGKLIVFEGIDGAGKSTQIANMAAFLKERGIEVAVSFEPTHGPYGESVRKAAQAGKRLQLEEEIFNLMQDRVEHVYNFIEPALKEGKWVLLDRYYPSMLAYQGASGADVAALRTQNETFAPKPDVCYWLDIPVATALMRVHARGESDEFEKADFLVRCRDGFGRMQDEWMKRIDAGVDVEEVWECILRDCAFRFDLKPGI